MAEYCLVQSVDFADVPCAREVIASYCAIRKSFRSMESMSGVTQSNKGCNELMAMSVASLKGLFGKPSKEVSIDDMNQAIIKRGSKFFRSVSIRSRKEADL